MLALTFAGRQGLRQKSAAGRGVCPPCPAADSRGSAWFSPPGVERLGEPRGCRGSLSGGAQEPVQDVLPSEENGVHRCILAPTAAPIGNWNRGHQQTRVRMFWRPNHALDGPDFVRAFLTMVCCECAADLADAGELLQRSPRHDEIENTTRALALLGQAIRGDELSHALRVQQRIARRVGAFFEAYDRYQPLKRGKPHARLTADELRQLEPGLRGDLLGGFSFDEWGIDGARLCVANAVDAMERGARVHVGCTVERIERPSGRS